jgi:hypothetical protein
LIVVKITPIPNKFPPKNAQLTIDYIVDLQLKNDTPASRMRDERRSTNGLSVTFIVRFFYIRFLLFHRPEYLVNSLVNHGCAHLHTRDLDKRCAAIAASPSINAMIECGSRIFLLQR